MNKRVAIDCFPESLARYPPDWAVVAVDVIRATTTAVTAVSTGRRVFPAATLEKAMSLAARLDNALLVGELGGTMPYGFDLTNSPAAIETLADLHRPAILLSTSGTRLLSNDIGRAGLYAACLRNVHATVEAVATSHDAVVVIGAGTRGEFRSEDQIGCARIAAGLIHAGFRPVGRTADVVAECGRASVDRITLGASAQYLITTGQLADLRFILTHQDDLDVVVALQGDELVRRPAESGRTTLAVS